MKSSILLSVFLLVLSGSSYSRNWYISNSGDDGYNGVIEYPWKTLAKLNMAFPYLADGDSVFLKRGETFPGNIRFTAASSSHIFLGAYGNGAKPVVTGFVTVTGWTEISPNIWQAALNGSNNVGMLTINGVVTPMGRYPNRGGANDGYLTYQSPVSSSVITDPALGNSPNWTGAEVVIRKTHWIIDRGPVVSQNNGTITFTPPTSFAGIPGFGYFFQNDARTLDLQGEWYYNPSAHTIQIYSATDPDLFTVNASVQDTLLYMTGRDNLTFDNITFSGSNLATFMVDHSQHLAVQDCDILYSGLNGVRADLTSYISFTGNQVLNTGNNAVYAITTNSSFTGNHIKNTGLWPGMGKSDNQAHMGLLTGGSDNLIQYNQVDSTGYNAIYFNGNNAQVKNNFVNQFCLTTDDGGGIYASGETTATGRVLKENFVFNGKGNHNGTNGSEDVAANGIYLDDLTAGVTIESNAVANCSENGIFVHNGHDVIIRDNTVYNTATQALFHHDPLGTEIRNIAQYDNIFFSKDTNQVSMRLGNTSNGATDDFALYGSFDSNYYCRPFKDTLNIQKNLAGTVTAYGLAGWKPVYGYDAHSYGSPVKISPTLPQATGAAKFSNSAFNSGITGFFPLGNYDTLLIENKIDGNTLKFGTSSSTANLLGLYFSIGSVTNASKYLVKFSLQGRKDGDFTLQLIKDGNPYNGISELRTLHYNSNITEYEIVFNATASENALLVLRFTEQDAPIWIDNLDVHEASMVAVNPDDLIKYAFNYSSSPANVSLDGTYIDAKGNVYSGNITLAAWRSAVLIKQPAAVQIFQRAAPVALQQISSLGFNIYPNPAKGSFRIALDNDMPVGKTQVLIYTMNGKLQTSFYMNATSQQVNTTGWASGMYLVKIIGGSKTLIQKLITL